ncbi:hypothetical protein WJX74_000698 [Apatococcus lobatus]|uniref:N-acetyl-D-glucosamine kinase n=1 Tax=Apatococcus lobatus TaxID=904363 RepID=A0AAW1RY42_9CHLO
MTVVVGVDGGATKTVCVLLEIHTRKELARSAGPASNWNSVGLERAVQAIADTVHEALLRSGTSEEALAGACFGLAGADRPQDKKQLEHALTARLRLKVPVLVQNDAVTALSGGTLGHLSGVILIAGTGTIVTGLLPDGSEVRVCGWGPTFLDGGCGFDIGQKGLAAVARAVDGRGSETTLTAAIDAYVGVQHPQDLLGWAYAEQDWARIASLAPTVLACAQGGDTVAASIVTQACEDLVAAATAAVDKCKFEGAFPLVLSGGLLQADGIFARQCRQALQARIPLANVVWPQADAATGAALLMCNHLQSMNNSAAA